MQLLLRSPLPWSRRLWPSIAKIDVGHWTNTCSVSNILIIPQAANFVHPQTLQDFYVFSVHYPILQSGIFHDKIQTQKEWVQCTKQSLLLNRRKQRLRKWQNPRQKRDSPWSSRKKRRSRAISFCLEKNTNSGYTDPIICWYKEVDTYGRVWILFFLFEG